MYKAELELFRVVREDTLKTADNLTQEQSEFTPAPGKWSVGEVLDHLLLSERLYRNKFVRLIELAKAGEKPVLRSSFSEIDTSVLFIPRSVLPLLDIPFSIFNMFVPSFAREILTEFRLMPSQNPRIAVPRKGKPVLDLRQGLRSSLGETEALFESNHDLDYRRMRFSHPLMGDNSVLGVLRIMAMHERRHQSQMRDVLRARGFPAKADAAAADG